MALHPQKHESDLFNKIVDSIGIFGILFLIALSIFYFGDLPDIIPRHYALNGMPDGFGKKAIIWFLTVIGLIIYTGMFLPTKYPHVFNYPKKLTKKKCRTIIQKYS